MNQQDAIKIFEEKQVRTLWDEDQEEWYVSIVDVIEILAESKNPQAYWRKLKQRLKEEGNETVTNCHGLKMKAADGKMRLTDEWKDKGVQEGLEFATLTDIITKTWADKTSKEYKILKGLKKENLRDNMTNTELILNMLAEASTKDISQATNPKNLDESKKVAKQGGDVAKEALEAKTGKKVVTDLNAKTILENKK
ncbi:MAG: hypothetical protein L3J19_01950 [Sulfurimonas sp.]|nr:hypothetical protein [Sulfurimonas sp.]